MSYKKRFYDIKKKLRVFKEANIFLILKFFVIFVIFFILASPFLAYSYRGRVMPQYYFLGSALNHIKSEQLEWEVRNRLSKIDFVNFYRPQYKQIPAENFLINVVGTLSLSKDTFNEKKEYIFNGSWLEAYKIFFGFFRRKIDLGEKWLVMDEKKVRENYLKKDGNVAESGEGSAHLTIMNDGRVVVSEDSPEIKDNFENFKNIFKDSLKNYEYKTAFYFVEISKPKVTVADWEVHLDKIRNMIKSPLKVNFSFSGENILFNSLQVAKWISIDNNKLVFEPKYIEQSLRESSFARFEKRPIDPEFVYDKNTLRVLKFRKEVNGQKFETESLAKFLNQEVLQQNRQFVSKNLQTTSWPSEKKMSEINPFGISEVLGTGYSSMRNSAPERFANITNGINKLDGVLVAPGQEFSTIGQLSPFTIANGYVEGLAIKKKKILPEVGGGMCQVSTTLFRAAMNSGLKITDRTNHSVVVNYYNDPRNGLPGTDATIYEPAPDFKFLNDTQNYILIDTRVEAGGRIYFDFWGTQDGRSGYFTPPQVLSRTESKDDPVYDLSSSMPTGQVRCSGPFNGMSTTFTYIRKLANGTVEKIPYFSYYRPQGQNCLVGM